MERLTLLFFFLYSYTSAQNTFERTYGDSLNDEAKRFAATTDGGYILSGYSKSFSPGNYNFYLTKVNSDGAQIWSKTYGGDSADYGFSCQQAKDGGYILAGSTRSFGAGLEDILIVKTDSGGNVQWSKTYGGVSSDVAYSIQQTFDGGYIVAGTTTSFGAGYSDIYLIKTDSAGTMAWSKTYGGTAIEYVDYVLQTSDSGYAVTGSYGSSGAGMADMYLLKVTKTGTVQWGRTFGGTSTDWGRCIVQTADGGYAVSGHSYSFALGVADMYLVKVTSSGSLQWSKTYGWYYDETATSLRECKSGGYILAGYYYNLSIGHQSYLIKTDTTGTPVWKKVYPDSIETELNGVLETADGGFIAAGNRGHRNVLKFDMFLMKTDSNGTGGCRDSIVGVVGNPATISAGFTPTITTNPNATVNSVVVTAGGGGNANTLCFTTNISNNVSHDLFSVYPNPAHFSFTISFEGFNESRSEKKLQIIDLAGRCVYEKEIRNSKLEIKDAKFSSGLYFVKVSDGERSGMQKLVIQ